MCWNIRSFSWVWHARVAGTYIIVTGVVDVHPWVVNVGGQSPECIPWVHVLVMLFTYLQAWYIHCAVLSGVMYISCLPR